MDLRYTFFNCPTALPIPRNVPIACLSSRHDTILATSLDNYMTEKNTSHCRSISTVLMPYQGPSLGYGFATNLNQDVLLTWTCLCAVTVKGREGLVASRGVGQIAWSDALIFLLHLTVRSHILFSAFFIAIRLAHAF
ncbi:uncharacterized protein LOC116189161 [Punica granatum]|uniref:RING-type E3 ubiquitin transferase n=1 Tax=Punica granatum TaxID=22663 RepID=A0A6P8BW35_PUNGR|nr:uncharacterized protein LOC116189161 [Punica granatum]